MKTLVIGAAVIDMIMTIDNLPESGADVICSSSSIMVGGCAYNVASTMRNLKYEHDLCVPVGTGHYACIIENELKKNGYPVLIKENDIDNGYCLCIVEKDGERTFITSQGAEGSFRREWFDNLNIDEYDSVYVAGYQMLGESGINIVSWLNKLEDVQIYFAPGPVICQINKDVMDEILALKPIIHLNDKELLEYTEKTDIKEGIRELYNITGNTVIVTVGAEGAIFCDGKKTVTVPSVKAEVCDTIGAGDSHIGAVISCLSRGMSLEEAVEKANSVAAEIVKIRGAVLSKDEFDIKLGGLFLDGNN